ncbi:MAG: N-formylglutamate amidohydrolase [Prochlorococcaceae cyanobacterium]
MPLTQLLSDDDPPVFSIERARGRSAVLIACDHAGRAIPRRLNRLQLSDDTLSTHVAWDLGIADLGRRLSRRLDAFLIQQNYSRLVIDANRPPHAADSIAVVSERTRIAANEGLSEAKRRQRLEEVFDPYHRRIGCELDRRTRQGIPCVLVALHSFTPTYLGEERPWHAGVLFGRDPRLGRLLHARLSEDSTLRVGENVPYAVSDESDYTIVVHGEQRSIPHVELEIRQDLLMHDSGLDHWNERLAQALEATVPLLFRRPSC